MVRATIPTTRTYVPLSSPTLCTAGTRECKARQASDQRMIQSYSWRERIGGETMYGTCQLLGFVNAENLMKSRMVHPRYLLVPQLLFWSCAFFFLECVIAEQVSNWQAYLEPHPTFPETKYKLVFEWDHIHDETIFVDGENGGRVYNADNDPRCNGDSSIVARDGQPFWMPRFFPKPVSQEITQVTGVKFASADWQPCGHKEITICHAESHYDFHMYYEDESVMNALPMCNIGVPTNPDLPVCQDSATEIANHEYFRLVNHSIPVSMSVSSPLVDGALVREDKNFCVDPSSAVLRSGVHYGDASETLEEWKTPVTITGSHNCELKFFEPMFSWKWVSGCVPESQTSWPIFEVRDIQYTRKGIESMPDSWKIEVSEDCKAASCFPGEMDPPTSNQCHIKITAEGDKCPESGCSLLNECGAINDCSTGTKYVSPWIGASTDIETPISTGGDPSESSGAVGFPGPVPAPMPVPTVSVISPLSFNCGTWCQPTLGSSPTGPTFPQPNSFVQPPPPPMSMPVSPNFPVPTSFVAPPPAPTPTGPTFNLPTSFGVSTPQGPTIVEVAVGDGRFTTLVAALDSLGLTGTLSGPGPFTVFAPIDEAFEDVPARFLQTEFSLHLRQVLLYHVVGNGAVSASQLFQGQSIPTLAGENVEVTDYELPKVELNTESDVILADVKVTSTILDRVIANPFLSKLESLLIAAGLSGVFDGTDGEVYTVFAPSNAAFNKLPADLVAQLTDPANVATLQEVLLFHVVSGSVIPSDTLTSSMQIKGGLSVTSLSPTRLNGSIVTSPNILAGNGIVHLIDTVLIPPSLSGSTTNSLKVESGIVRSNTYAMSGLVGLLIISLL